MVSRWLSWRMLVAAGLGFLAGLAIGISVYLVHPHATQIYRTKGVLTSPLLGFEVNTYGEFSELNPIENAIHATLAERLNKEGVTAISVYFRLLNSGRWFSINEDELYSPASLLKIPVMMAYYKEAEIHPEILQKRLVFADTFVTPEQSTVPEERRLQLGQSYTMEDLIGRMMRDSNNHATELLERNLPTDYIAQIYEELEVESPYMREGDFMSVADYPFLLRVLYNATYLSESYSEKALQLLTESSFTEGLPAKLPEDVKVAHKFGFRIDRETTPQSGELHDCGIVYYPDHPYILCVMTKGYASEPLTLVLQDLSLVTYDSVKAYFASRQ